MVSWTSQHKLIKVKKQIIIFWKPSGLVKFARFWFRLHVKLSASPIPPAALYTFLVCAKGFLPFLYIITNVKIILLNINLCIIVCLRDEPRKRLGWGTNLLMSRGFSIYPFVPMCQDKDWGWKITNSYTYLIFVGSHLTFEV